jgi:hypothetical protein
MKPEGFYRQKECVVSIECVIHYNRVAISETPISGKLQDTQSRVAAYKVVW